MRPAELAHQVGSVRGDRRPLTGPWNGLVWREGKMGNRESKGFEQQAALCATVGMPIYWPDGKRTDAGLPPVWPFLVAPLSGQNPRYLPAVLLALLESPAAGRETAEDQTTTGPQDGRPAAAHTDPRATTGCRCNPFIARISEERRLPDAAERPELRLSGAAARVLRRNKQHRTAERITGAAKPLSRRSAMAD